MENSIERNQFTVGKKEDREKLLEKRLLCVNNQIDWLNKIKKTLERQLFEEDNRNF